MSQLWDMLKIYGLFFASIITLIGSIFISVAVSSGDLEVRVLSGSVGAVMVLIGLTIIWSALRKPRELPRSPYPPPPQHPQYPAYPPYPSYPQHPSYYPYLHYQPPPPHGYYAPPYPSYYPPGTAPQAYPQAQQPQTPPPSYPPPSYYPQAQAYHPQAYQPAYGPPPPQYMQPRYPRPYPDSRGYGAPSKDTRLNLPNIYTLLAIFIASIFLGALSLFFGWPAILFFPIAFVIAFSFPSLMWISYVYRKDVHEPEPKRAVLIALTFGFLCTIPALLLSIPFVIFFPGMVVATVIGAPLVEEFCKASGLPLVKSEMNAEIDGVIYGVTLGMGFAMVENFLYELDFVFIDPALWTFGSLLRGLGSTIGHGLGAGMIGYAYAAYIMDRKRPGALRNVVFAYMAAVGLHALWNGIAYLTGESVLGLIIIILIAFAEVMILRTLVSVARDKDVQRRILTASERSFQVFKGGGEEKVQRVASTSRGRDTAGNSKGDFRCPRCQQAIEVPQDGIPASFRCPVCNAFVNIH